MLQYSGGAIKASASLCLQVGLLADRAVWDDGSGTLALLTELDMMILTEAGRSSQSGLRAFMP
jgi:hypothetical protein